MKFKQHESSWQLFRHTQNELPERDRYDCHFDFYMGHMEKYSELNNLINQNLKDPAFKADDNYIKMAQRTHTDYTRYTAEGAWYYLRRPFYNVYPCMDRLIETALTTDLTRQHLHLPSTAPRKEGVIPIEIRTREDSCLYSVIERSHGDGTYCESDIDWFLILRSNGGGIFAVSGNINKRSDHPFKTGMLKWINANPDDDHDFISWREVSSILNPKTRMTNDAARARYFLGVIAAIHMIAGHEDIVDRVLLNKDDKKLSQLPEIDPAKKERAVNKAENNGVIGWSFGRKLENMPVYRRPHFGIRWMKPENVPDEIKESLLSKPEEYTNDKGLVSVLRPIKGSISNIEKAKRVPTGFRPTSDQLNQKVSDDS